MNSEGRLRALELRLRALELKIDSLKDITDSLRSDVIKLALRSDVRKLALSIRRMHDLIDDLTLVHRYQSRRRDDGSSDEDDYD